MADPIDTETLAAEVGDSNFADERLNKRLRLVIAGLAVEPARSLPRSFDDAGLEGAYRFFSNPRITPDDILSSHVKATRARCANGGGDFLVIHDSTNFTYRFDGEREGLGRAQRDNPNSMQMFFAHASVAVASDGTRRPLGVAALTTWVRGSVASGVEYQRWERQVRVASDHIDGHDRAIHVMDREADDYDMFTSLMRDGYRFVTRGQHNRWLEQDGPARLRDAFTEIECTVSREASLSRRKPSRNHVNNKVHPPRAERTVRLNVAAGTVALKRPQSRRAHVVTANLPRSLRINVVRVWEAAPPEGVEGVEWFLFTTEPIETAEQQLAIVDHYRARWTIEEYFKAIKTGCSFERRQLQDYESLINLLAAFAPIAYQLLLIRSEARRAPDASALTVLTTDHIAVLRAKGRTKLSENPTTREVYLAIAVLGGHIKYSKKDPGWLTLARGLEDLELLTEGWRLAKLQHGSDQR